MAFPAGVSTCTVSFGTAPVFIDGDLAALTVTVRPVLGGNAQHLVWEETGQPLVAMLRTKSESAGVPVQFVLPHVDQPGFRDGAGNEATGWSYQATVTARLTSDPTQTAITWQQVFQVLVGQESADADLIPDGTVMAPGSAPVPAVTSLQGLTGAVVLESGDNVTIEVVDGAIVISTDGGGGTTNASDLDSGTLALARLSAAVPVTYAPPSGGPYARPAGAPGTVIWITPDTIPNETTPGANDGFRSGDLQFKVATP